MVDWQALYLTLQLALLVALILIFVATPVSWWLAVTQSRLKPFIEVMVTLPLVLPPTVLGFYVLLLFSPDYGFGAFWQSIGGSGLAFSFQGLVFASVIYSLPFAIQPLSASFKAIGSGPYELAASLGASRWQRFFFMALPLSVRGYVTAFVLSFAHTLGEFGVVLMVGGNIPGQTHVISIALYEQVEQLDFAGAHKTAIILIIICFLILLPVYSLPALRSRNKRGHQIIS